MMDKASAQRPVVLAVDDDPQVLRALVADLRPRYGREYRVLGVGSAKEGADTLQQLKDRGEVVALLLSDQRMPDLDGVGFLTAARAQFPEARRVLLTAYSDTEAAIRAINEARLDHYLLKPWDPPAQHLFPVLDGLLSDWRTGFKPEGRGPRIVGYQWSAATHALKDFLAGNLIPYRWLNAERDDEAAEVMARVQLSPAQLPAIFFEDGTHLETPSLEAVGQKLNLGSTAVLKLYDVAIVGAGPAGLAAAVYGASEGLRTLLVDRRAPGGQAGTSSRIENYLGFPSGVTGAELAQRAITQARRFGAEFLVPQTVQGFRVEEKLKVLSFASGPDVTVRALVLTSGMDYRKLEAAGIERFTGAGVYYGAASTEAASCTAEDVVVVGGGNSAGQAAMDLSRYAHRIYLVIRKPDLSSTMSQYLIDQLARTPNVELVPFSELAAVEGDTRVRSVTLQVKGNPKQVPAAAVYVFIGTRPTTDWLPEAVLKDSKGFVLTGRDLLRDPRFARQWTAKREPMLLETSVPGVFAAGDVRSTAMNRVASAVGEGAMAIKFTHEFLAGV
jgi:thioredoxin reductase (NADPH)